MKKITLFLSVFFTIMLAGTISAQQHDFAAIPGPTLVAQGTPVTLNINDAGNMAGVPVPSSGTYSSFSVSVDWADNDNAYSSEADLTMTTTAGTVLIDPASTGSADSGTATTMTFVGDFTTPYDPSVDGFMDIVLRQSWGGSSANWSNIVVTIFPTPTCIAPDGLSVANVTAYSVDLNWNDLGGTTDYEFAIQAAGTGEPAVNGVYADYNTLPLTAADDVNYTPLTSSTAYEVWVRADCGGNGYSAWVGPVNFTTSSVVTCGTPENVTYCYTDNDSTTWTFTSSDGSPLRITFNAGGIESCCDDILIYDGTDNTGTLLYSGNNGGDLTGLTFDSTSDSLFIEIDSDGSVSCSAGSTCCTSPWDFTVACATCVNPAVTFTAVPDCGNSQYSIDVDLTSLGSATSVTISDGVTTLTNISAIGVQNFGPYANGATATIVVTNEQDGTCSFSSGAFTYTCPPANDECDNAVALTVNADLNCTVVTAGTTVAATDSGIEPTFDVTGTPDNDVWFSFVATGAAHRISLTNVVAVVGTSTDMGMAVFDGTGTCSSLTLVGSSDPNTYNATGLTAGVTYYVAVYGWGSGPGAQATFDICVGTPPAPPVNDECSGAIALTVNPDFNCAVQTSGTVLSATASAVDATACFGTEDDDVWFSFVATATSHRIQLNNAAGSTTDLYHSLWTGADCNSLALVPGTCSDPNTSNPSGLTIGETYYVRVYTYTGTTGQTTTFDICVGTPPPPPANDECSGAIALTVNPDLNCGTVTPGTITSATASAVDATACLGTENDDVWFSFVATATSHRIDLTDVVGSTTNLYHSLWTGADCNSLTLVPGSCSDPNSSSPTGLTIGETYYLRVYSFGGTAQSTTFNVCVGTFPPPPANDECSGAIALTVNPDYNCGAVTPGTITSATASAVDATACTGTEDDDVWFSFVATATTHRIDLINIVGNTDLYHSLWTGADCNSLALVPGTCSDPNTSNPSGLTIGTTYYVRIYTYSAVGGQVSSFDVCVGTAPPPPANDECDNAIALTVNADYNCGVVTSATNLSATASPQVDDVTGTPNNDVWFSFVAVQATHRVSLTNIIPTPGTTSFDMGMGVYDATNGCSALTFVADSDPNTLNLTGLTIGNTYLVRVYNWGTNAANTDNFDICVGTDPALSSSSFDAANFKAYPNPVRDILNLEYKSEISNVQVINLLGQIVINRAVNTTSTQVDMSQLNAGAYIVNVTIDGNVETIKVVKQ